MVKKNIGSAWLFILMAGAVGGQNVIIKIAPSGSTNVPPNYPIEIQDAGASSSVPSGWSSNWTWAAYYAARPSFDTQWTNWLATNQVSQQAIALSNRVYWTAQRDGALSNVLWMSTNVSVLNATLGASNALMLRAAEERLKNF